MNIFKKNAMALAALAIAATSLTVMSFDVVKTSDKQSSVRFQFDNTPSGEANPSNWDHAPSASCGNQANNACVIEVSTDVVSTIGGNLAIDPAKLQSQYGSPALPMTSDANGTRPTPGPVYQEIDNRD